MVSTYGTRQGSIPWGVFLFLKKGVCYGKKIIDLKEIDKELIKIKNKFESDLVKSAEINLIRSYDSIVKLFYDTKPKNKQYHRKHNLYNGLHSHKTWGDKAKIIVSDNDVQDVYKASKEVVFDYFWNKGLRGLPKQGSKLLTHSYNYLGTQFNFGEKWVNPYWSGESTPYYNIFNPSITLGGYTTIKGSPSEVMKDFVENWDKAYGLEECKKIEDEIKNRRSKI